MRIFVTGASGEIGRALRRQLHAHPDIVPVYGLRALHPDFGGDARIVDVSNQVQFDLALRAIRPAAIVHLAGITSSNASTDSRLVEDVNVGSVKTVATALEEGIVNRVVFSSSAAVYGDQYVDQIDESFIPNPRSEYGEAKLRAEALLQSHRTVSSGGSVSLRVFNVFGDPNSRSLVTKLKRSTPRDPAKLLGWNDYIRDYIHVDDVARALIAAIKVPLREQHLILNLASGIATSNRLLIDTLRRNHDIHYELVQNMASYSWGNPNRALERLSFSAQRPLS